MSAKESDLMLVRAETEGQGFVSDKVIHIKMRNIQLIVCNILTVGESCQGEWREQDECIRYVRILIE